MDVRYGEVIYTNTYSRTFGGDDFVTTRVFTQVHVTYAEEDTEEVVTILTKDVSCRTTNRVAVVYGSSSFIPIRQRPIALVNMTTRQVGLIPHFMWGRILLLILAFAGCMISAATRDLVGKQGILISLLNDDFFNIFVVPLLFLAVVPALKLLIWKRIDVFAKGLLT